MNDPQAMHTALAMLAIMPVVGLIMAVIVIVPMWFIWKKAGFSPWLGLLSIVPLVNFIMLYVLAFSEWRVTPAQQPNWPQV